MKYISFLFVFMVFVLNLAYGQSFNVNKISKEISSQSLFYSITKAEAQFSFESPILGSESAFMLNSSKHTLEKPDIRPAKYSSPYLNFKFGYLSSKSKNEKNMDINEFILPSTEHLFIKGDLK